jgi:hypothetical protein
MNSKDTGQQYSNTLACSDGIFIVCIVIVLRLNCNKLLFHQSSSLVSLSCLQYFKMILSKGIWGNLMGRDMDIATYLYFNRWHKAKFCESGDPVYRCFIEQETTPIDQFW